MTLTTYNSIHKTQTLNIFKIYWTDPEFLDELSLNLESTLCNFYVALDDDEVLGVAGVRRVNNFLKDYATSDSPVELYVLASKHKGVGTGSKLLSYAVSECKNMNYTEMLCYSPETHDGSWRFYESNGFTSLGIANDPDDGCAGMVWRLVI